MFKYLKYLIPKPIYIWHKKKQGFFLAIHKPYNKNSSKWLTGKRGSHWFEYLDDASYIHLNKDIDVVKPCDGTIGDFVKSGRAPSRRRDYIKSLPDRNFSALRDRVHGRETIKPE